MQTLSLSEVKMKLSALVESVRTIDDEIIITKNGRPAAVLVSTDEFASWKETATVRFDADLMEEIQSGVKELDTNKASLYSLEELFLRESV